MKKKFVLNLFINLILILHLLIILTFLSKLSSSPLEYKNVYVFYLVILFISTLIVIFCIIKNHRKIYLIYFSISLLTLYFFEINIFLKNNKSILDLKIEISKKKNSIFDARSREDYIKHKRLITKNIFPSFTFKNLKKDIEKENIYPLSGISMAQTIMCNENGNFIEFFSDRYGFNNKNEIWDLEKINFILIGDSFVFGNCVTRDQNLLSNLENITNKKGLNLGYENSGTLFQLAIIREFKEIIKKKEIKKLIWLFYDFNDLRDLDIEMENKILRKYLEKKNYSQNYINKQDLKDKILKKIINEKLSKINNKSELKTSNKLINIQNLLQILLFKNLRSKINVKYLLPKNQIDFDENHKKNLGKILYNLKEIEKELGIDLYLFYLPTHTWKSNEEIITFIKNKNVKIIDLYNELYKKQDRWELFPYGLSGHFNPEGYKELSQVIFNFAFKN